MPGVFHIHALMVAGVCHLSTRLHIPAPVGADVGASSEWAEVRSAMPVPAWLLKRGGRPEAYCHREMLVAVRYLVDKRREADGCAGRLPVLASCAVAGVVASAP
ncbi:hypothetical protein [Streptomyces sviceus]|uniref:hypothetical protein n=1 Tax=Streptomyces sviceus TaxID=285530 RepID=UPI0036A881B8